MEKNVKNGGYRTSARNQFETFKEDSETGKRKLNIKAVIGRKRTLGQAIERTYKIMYTHKKRRK
jgi:hypothetical protein